MKFLGKKNMYIVKKILWGWGSKNLNMVKKTIQIKKKLGIVFWLLTKKMCEKNNAH